MGIHADLTKRTRAVMPSWLALYYDEPIAIDRGEGRTVWDLEGNEYLDFFGGILTTMTAYSLPEVTAAINEQAAKVLHTSTLYLNQPMIELAEMVAEMSGIPDARVFFTPSGTEANDAAMLLATSYRKSNQVLALRNSYHGRSFTAVALTSHRSWSPTGYSGLNVQYVQGPYKSRSPYANLDDDAFVDAAVADLQQVIDMMTSGDVAAMIAEPIQGVGGFATPPDGFFKRFKDVLDDYGILFVSDEVQTGWGRTGEHLWGYQAHGITPDIMTFAKGITSGYWPVGACVVSDDVFAEFQGGPETTYGHGFTYGGHPAGGAAGLANVGIIEGEDLVGNSERMGARMLERLNNLRDRPGVGDVRGLGLMCAVELVKDKATKEPITAIDGARKLLIDSLTDGGMLARVAGHNLLIAPPLTVNEQEVDEMVDIAEASIAHVEKTFGIQ